MWEHSFVMGQDALYGTSILSRYYWIASRTEDTGLLRTYLSYVMPDGILGNVPVLLWRFAYRWEPLVHRKLTSSGEAAV